MSERAVLITGCGGFLGSWLADSLCQREKSITGLLNAHEKPSILFEQFDLSDRIRIFQGSINDRPLIERIINEQEIDVIFHLAAQSQVSSAIENPGHTFTVNIEGTWKLLDAVRNAKRTILVILVSTVGVYGDAMGGLCTEATPVRSRFPYEVSKACSEMIVQCYGFTYGLSVSIVRFCNLYGPGDSNYNRIIPSTIRAVFLGEHPRLRSDGRGVRNYLYVQDAVEALLTIADALQGDERKSDLFNICGTSATGTLEIVDTILKMMDREDLTPGIQSKSVSEAANMVCSSEKIRKQLGWYPKFSLQEGIRQTIDWYREQWEKNSGLL